MKSKMLHGCLIQSDRLSTLMHLSARTTLKEIGFGWIIRGVWFSSLNKLRQSEGKPPKARPDSHDEKSESKFTPVGPCSCRDSASPEAACQPSEHQAKAQKSPNFSQPQPQPSVQQPEHGQLRPTQPPQNSHSPRACKPTSQSWRSVLLDHGLIHRLPPTHRLTRHNWWAAGFGEFAANRCGLRL